MASRAGANPGASAVPHSEQNFWPGDVVWPHAGHDVDRLAPHSMQNLAPGMLSVPQCGQPVAPPVVTPITSLGGHAGLQADCRDWKTLAGVVLATYNIKGGVGKTSAAVNLAYLAARAGATTLLWDLDPQGGSTYLLRIKPKVKGGGRRLVRGKSDASTRIKGTDYDRLDLLPADFSYRHMDLDLDSTERPTRTLGRVLAPLVPEYDYVFLDCPPSISLVSESVFEAADALLIPLLPATLSARTLEYIDQVAGADVQRLPFFSMVDARKRMHRDVMDEFATDRPEMLRTVIPLAADVERMGAAREPVEEFAPHGRAAEAFRDLWAEICERLARRASLH